MPLPILDPSGQPYRPRIDKVGDAYARDRMIRASIVGEAISARLEADLSAETRAKIIAAAGEEDLGLFLSLAVSMIAAGVAEKKVVDSRLHANTILFYGVLLGLDLAKKEADVSIRETAAPVVEALRIEFGSASDEALAHVSSVVVDEFRRRFSARVSPLK